MDKSTFRFSFSFSFLTAATATVATATVTEGAGAGAGAGEGVGVGEDLSRPAVPIGCAYRGAGRAFFIFFFFLLSSFSSLLPNACFTATRVGAGSSSMALFTSLCSGFV